MRKAVIALLLLALATSASAQRRRTVKHPSAAAPSNPTTGNCATYAPIRIGMKASYAVTADSGNITYTVTYLSDTGSRATTTQHIVTPQAVADAETTMDFENVPGAQFDLRALKRLYVKTTTVAQGFPFVIETDIGFNPSMVLGPLGGWCAGAKWNVPATVQTITNKSMAGTQTLTQTTIAYEGEVLAVGVMVTTPAGTFRTIKSKTLQATSTAVTPTIAWNSIDHNITVRQESLDASGRVIQVTELTKLE